MIPHSFTENLTTAQRTVKRSLCATLRSSGASSVQRLRVLTPISLFALERITLTYLLFGEEGMELSAPGF